MRALLPALLVIAHSPFATGADASLHTWKYTTGATADISVETVSGQVAVTAAPGSEVSIVAVIRGGSESDRALWHVESEGSGATVKVRARCGESGHDCNSSAHPEITVKAPPASRLSVKGVSADATIKGLTGDLHANTVSGDLTISGAGVVSSHTVSGNVHLDGAGEANLQSVSGDLALRSVQRSSVLQTVSGDIDWNGTCGSGCRLTAQTVSGDLRLHLSPASSFELDYRTRSGDLSDAFAGSLQGSGRGGAHTRVGKGEGSLSFRSVSGDLRLEKQ
jgi:DUF4097 and DUF4098 domain-containing protein YvlB